MKRKSTQGSRAARSRGVNYLVCTVALVPRDCLPWLPLIRIRCLTPAFVIRTHAADPPLSRRVSSEKSSVKLIFSPILFQRIRHESHSRRETLLRGLGTEWIVVEACLTMFDEGSKFMIA